MWCDMILLHFRLCLLPWSFFVFSVVRRWSFVILHSSFFILRSSIEVAVSDSSSCTLQGTCTRIYVCVYVYTYGSALRVALFVYSV